VAVALVWLAGCSDNIGRAPQDLTRRQPEPAGANCAYGGTAILSGIDSNTDDVLDDDEVVARAYECNPATTSLVRTDVVAADLTCPGGGSAVSNGIDDNNNGVLEDTEIDTTSVQCNSLEHWAGDFTANDWRDPVKVAALRGARVVDGSLSIATTDVVTLPLLELVHGNLTARGAMTELRLDALREIDGTVTIDALDLTVLSFAVLERIGGDLAVARTSEIGASITAPSLHDIAGGLRFASSAAGVVTFPQLATVGAIVADGSLSSLRLDGLVSVTGALAIGDRVLTHLVFPALTTVGGGLTVDALQLAALELPVLQQIGKELEVNGSPFLTTLALPALRLIGDQLTLRLVPALTTVDLGNVEDIHGSIRLENTEALAALALPKLSTVGSDPIGTGLALATTGLHELELPVLRTIIGGVSITQSAHLQELRFPALATVSAWSINDAPVLTRINLPFVSALQMLSLVATPALQTLDLPSLAQVSGGVTMSECGLSDLSGLRALAGAASIRFSATHLRDLRALSALHTLRILLLEDNAELTSLDGLDALSARMATITISNNDALTSIAALHNIPGVNLLTIAGNTSLLAVGLNKLSSVTGDFTLADNPALASLAGLSGLIAVDGTLRVTGNDAVPRAELAAFLTRLGR